MNIGERLNSSRLAAFRYKHAFYPYAKRLIVAWCTLFFLGLFAYQAFAKPTHVRRYTLEEGLVGSEVSSIVPLSNGLVLFATDAGIRLFDGYQFFHLVSSEKDLYKISDEVFYAALQDSKDNIWMSTAKGLFRFNMSDNSFQHFQHDSSNPNSLVNNNVRAIYEDTRGNIWLGTLNGLGRYSYKTDQFTQYIYDQGNANGNEKAEPPSLIDSIMFIVEDNSGKIWIGGPAGVRFYNYENDQFLTPDLPFKDYYATSATLSLNNQLWIGTDQHGLIRVDLNTNTQIAYTPKADSPASLTSIHVWSLFTDQYNHVWAGYWDKGFSIIKPETNQISHHNHVKYNPTTIPDPRLSAFSQGINDMVWIGTKNGAASYNPNALINRALTLLAPDASSFAETNIWALESDKHGNVWMASDIGLSMWNKNTGEVSHYTYNPQFEDSLTPGPIWDLEIVDEDIIILGTESGINLFNIKKSQQEKRAVATHLGSEDRSGNTIRDIAYYQIAPLSGRQFLLGSAAVNIQVLDLNTNQVQSLFKRDDFDILADAEYVNAIQADNKGNPIIGTTTGLFYFDRSSKELVSFTSGEHPNALTSNTINDIFVDKHNRAWLATLDGVNIVSLNHPNKEVIHLTSLGELPEKHVTNIVAGANKTVWVTTNRHLANINTDTLEVNTIPQISQEQLKYTAGGASVTHDGKIILGGLGGYIFDPTKVAFSQFNAPIRFTNIKSLHRQHLDFNVMNDDQTILISEQDTSLTIYFSALTYAYPKFNHYRYQLEGVDQDWVYAENNNFATYTHLPFGKFRFKVQYQIGNKLWSTATAELTLLNPTPFWRTYLAYSLYAVVLMILFWIQWRAHSRKAAKELEKNIAIKKNETRLKTALWASGDELWIWTVGDKDLLRLNPSIKIADLSGDHILQGTLLSVIHRRDRLRFVREIQKHIDGRSDFIEIQFRILNQDKEWQWLMFRGRTNPSAEDKNKLRISGAVKDINQIKHHEEQLTQLANFDPLTKLANRNYFFELMRQALADAKRHKESIALLFLDLDGFKEVNDALGHSFGDELLIEVAKRLKHALRVNDQLARLGGDEFTIILHRINNTDHVYPTIKRVLHALQIPFQLRGQLIKTSSSIGASLYPSDGEDPDTLLKNADIAMYEAKSSGKNAYRFYVPEMDERIRRRAHLEQEILKALETDGFQVFYQPRVHIESNTVISAEALIRWFHPELGFIPPDEFIPLAEDTGLITQITQWVIKEACKTRVQWQENGWQGSISVNITPIDLKAEGFIDLIEEALEQSQMPADGLELEITEGALIEDIDMTKEKLETLRGLGIKIALDDFGTGYSSLSYLQQLPFNTMKIDRAFIWKMEEDPRTLELTRAIILMAHSIGLEVVAEGIETESQLKHLEAFQCEQYQGYYFSKPLPSDEFIALIQSQ